MKVPPETRCRYCLRILCCSEHRIAHEIRRHSSSRRGNHHAALSSARYERTAETRRLSVEPNAPRKRKRESLLQETTADVDCKEKTGSSGSALSTSFFSSVTYLFRNVFNQSARQERWNITSEEVTEEESQNEESDRRRLVPIRVTPTDSSTTPRRNRSNALEEERPVFFAPQPRPPLHSQPRRILLSPVVGGRREGSSPLMELSLASIDNSFAARIPTSPVASS